MLARFRDVPLGVRFSYPGHPEVWVKVDTNTVVKPWLPEYGVPWVGQTAGCFSDTDDLDGIVRIDVGTTMSQVMQEVGGVKIQRSAENCTLPPGSPFCATCTIGSVEECAKRLNDQLGELLDDEEALEEIRTELGWTNSETSE